MIVMIGMISCFFAILVESYIVIIGYKNLKFPLIDPSRYDKIKFQARVYVERTQNQMKSQGE